MSEVVINSQPYDTYATVEYADLYHQANFLATNWFNKDQDEKGQLLVTATRLLDRQCWLGEPTGLSGQTLAWPRTGTGIEGVEDEVVPQDIVDGSVELALAIADGSDVVSSNVPGAQKLQNIRAGSVSLTWFRGAEGPLAQFGRFPLVVQELVRRYMCSSQRISGLVTSGTDGVSVTDNDLGYNEGV